MAKIKVDENNGVWIWIDGQEDPILHQPHYPNGDTFDSYEEALEWAEMKKEEMEDSEALFAPFGKGQEREARPTHQQALLHRLAAHGFSEEDLKIALYGE